MKQRTLEGVYSLSEGCYNLTGVVLSDFDGVYCNASVNGESCLFTYKDKSYLIATALLLVNIYEHFRIEVAIYDKSDLHNADIENILTEETRLLGKRLLNKCTVNRDITDNDIAVSSVEGLSSLVQKRLNSIYGQEELKQHLNTYIRHLHFKKLRNEGDKPFQSQMHMILTGNPGTGKTMMAGMLAQILFDIGITKSPNLTVKTRVNLVAQYIGQTAKMTRKIIENARGGTLFIDEAYTLASESERDFGKEAIEEIMNNLHDEDAPVFIFAGYKKEMEKFIETNPGFERRVPNIFHFNDYTCNDLAEIMQVMLLRRKYEFPINMNFADIFSVIPQNVRSVYNASLCEKLCQQALFSLESRLPLDCSKAEASRFHENDFIEGMRSLRDRLVKSEQVAIDVETQTDISIPVTQSIEDTDFKKILSENESK